MKLMLLHVQSLVAWIQSALSTPKPEPLKIVSIHAVVTHWRQQRFWVLHPEKYFNILKWSHFLLITRWWTGTCCEFRGRRLFWNFSNLATTWKIERPHPALAILTQYWPSGASNLCLYCFRRILNSMFSTDHQSHITDWNWVPESIFVC